MLKINNISYKYHSDHWIFDSIQLNVNPGEVVGIYGPSGVGKSTFAKVIAGYLKPDRGSIIVNGKVSPQIGRNPVQLIGQHPEKAINPHWRMKQVLAESGEYSDGFLSELGISKEWMHRFPSQLSGGELQRFCLARAIAPETSYLIADEMTTMLDAITQAQIWQTVLLLVERRQLGMLVISHELPLLKQISNRILNFEELARAI
ncbi:ABC transporter ATP-binding protein [Arenibacter certesii]|uniref:Nickel ABC transporter ATP-binding protein n=1 Tax=Arenibacter certesii TaxID=228955 RepID=A0A918IQ28_9FLAO|nr:ATP-binding cassette domain-containing protein [Arenibacter certesii]GGW26340.1 nickel ABC transporter ATP-binding protein [Arenibacter certesii]